MSASKRDFTDFNNFPGKINNGNGLYEFPTLRHKDAAGRIRIWNIFIRLVKDDNRQSTIDWNLLSENQIPIKNSYLHIGNNYEDLPHSVIAEVWTETGVEGFGFKITRNIPTYFDKVSFKGQINQRNIFQNALIKARADYIKRSERGGSDNKSGNKKNTNTNVMYFPMLAKAWKDGNKHIKYPCYIQPKLDGVRCLTYIERKNGDINNVIMYTRTKKHFPNVEYLQEILLPFLKNLFDDSEKPYQSIYLDGELYKHGQKLQDISGRSRNEEKTNMDDFDLDNINEYHIYDCFYPECLDLTFSERKQHLDDLYDEIKNSTIDDYEYLPKGIVASDIIKPVHCDIVNNLSDANKLFEKYTKLDYEGIMFRNMSGVYLANSTKTGSFMRSNDLVKMKQKFSDEYEVVGYTEGKRGKDKGAIIWICKTKNNERFNVTPKNITYEERKELFINAENNFEKKYLGRMITVEYEDLSKKNVPQRAKALTFRDYE